MNRRSLLKSIGALSVLPIVPSLPASAMATGITATSASVSHHTYMWAEMIVRAHNKCSPGMLERLLQVDTATASILKNQLLEKGIISANANAFGIHTAVKPLYEGAFVRPSSQLKSGLQKANEQLNKMMTEDEEIQEKESEINDLEDKIESDEELEREEKPSPA